MKKISILIPTYNEEDNVELLANKIISIFDEELKEYEYEIVFTDNKSVDNTRKKIEKICNENSNVKAIFNTKNFNSGSGMNGLRNTTGDCTIFMAADFQDPPEMIPEFIKKWESGVKIVLGVKKNSKTNPVMHCIRTMYYKLMKKICTVEQLEHVTGFGLYDRSFLEILKSMNDPLPYLRGMVTEFESSIDTIDFVQPKRNSGKSSWNFMGLYDIAMRGITNYSKIPLRIATCLGGLCLILWFLTGIFGFIVFILFDISCTTLYLILWIIIGLLSMQFIFIGILGEYIVNINIRTMNHPTIVEEKRINFYNLEQEIH